MKETAERRKKKNSPHKPIIIMALLAFLLLVVVAFVFDMQYIQKVRLRKPLPTCEEDLASVLVMEPMVTYQDPGGLFTQQIPEGWKKVNPLVDGPQYTALFESPYGYRYSVKVTELDKSKTFATLKREIYDIQNRQGLNMNVEEVDFKGHRAVKRDVTLHHSRLVRLDFMVNGVAHEIQIDVPHRFGSEAVDILTELFQGYEPVSIEGR